MEDRLAADLPSVTSMGMRTRTGTSTGNSTVSLIFSLFLNGTVTAKPPSRISARWLSSFAYRRR